MEGVKTASTVAFVALIAFLSPNPGFAYGVPDAMGKPNIQERILLVLTNQIRQAPHDWPGWDTNLAPSTSLVPLAEQTDLFEAARYHADDMADHDHFAHESSDGTPFSSRIQRYFRGASGENIYKSTNIDPYAAMTAWMNSEGHRTNILRPEWRLLGTGYALDGRFHYYVQNFGRSGDASTPLIPAGAAYLRGSSTVRVLVNYYDAAEEDPIKLEVSLGQRCIEMTSATGTAGNRTYQSDQTSPNTCAPVVFHATSAAGEAFRYPSTGALLVGNSCQDEFQSSNPATDPCKSSQASPSRTYIDAEAGGCQNLSSDFTRLDVLLLFFGPAMLWIRRKLS